MDVAAVAPAAQVVYITRSGTKVPYRTAEEYQAAIEADLLQSAEASIARELAHSDIKNNSEQTKRFNEVAKSFIIYYLKAPCNDIDSLKYMPKYDPAEYLKLLRNEVVTREHLPMNAGKNNAREPGAWYLEKQTPADFSGLVNGLSVLMTQVLNLKRTEQQLRPPTLKCPVKMKDSASKYSNAVQTLKLFLVDCLFTLGLVRQNEEFNGVQRRLINNLEILYEMTAKAAADHGITPDNVQLMMRALFCEDEKTTTTTGAKSIRSPLEEAAYIEGVLSFLRGGDKNNKKPAATTTGSNTKQSPASAASLADLLVEFFRYSTCTQGDLLEQQMHQWGFRPKVSRNSKDLASRKELEAYEFLDTVATRTLATKVHEEKKFLPSDVCIKGSTTLRPDVPQEIQRKLIDPLLVRAKDEVEFTDYDEAIKNQSSITRRETQRLVAKTFDELVQRGLGTDNAVKLLGLLFRSSISESEKAKRPIPAPATNKKKKSSGSQATAPAGRSSASLTGRF